MNEIEIQDVAEILERRLPVRALHHLSKTRRLPYRLISGSGLDDSTIHQELIQHGVDIAGLVRIKIAGVLANAEPPKNRDELFARVDQACRGQGNPLLPAVESRLREAGLIAPEG